MEKKKDFRDCGSCTECCKNLYIPDVHGHVVYPGSPCFFLCEEKKCTIHENRPKVCKDFQCAWSQNVLPEWMKPDKSNALVCVERWGKNKEKQMLRVVSINDGYDVKTFSWILLFCLETATPISFQIPGGIFKHIGPPEFMEYINSINKIQ